MATLSPWLLVGISVERTLVVYLPHRIHSLATKKMAYIYIAVCFIITGLVHIEILFNGKLIVNSFGVKCSVVHIVLSKFVSDLIEFLSVAVVPAFILTVCGFMMSVRLIYARRQRKRNLSVNHQSRAELQASVRAIAFSLVFVALVAPSMRLESMKWFDVQHLGSNVSLEELHSIGYIQAVINALAKCALEANYAVNLWLYLITGKRFRSKFFSVMTQCCSPDSTGNTRPA